MPKSKNTHLDSKLALSEEAGRPLETLRKPPPSCNTETRDLCFYVALHDPHLAQRFPALLSAEAHHRLPFAVARKRKRTSRFNAICVKWAVRLFRRPSRHAKSSQASLLKFQVARDLGVGSSAGLDQHSLGGAASVLSCRLIPTKRLPPRIRHLAALRLRCGCAPDIPTVNRPFPRRMQIHPSSKVSSRRFMRLSQCVRVGPPDSPTPLTKHHRSCSSLRRADPTQRCPMTVKSLCRFEMRQPIDPPPSSTR